MKKIIFNQLFFFLVSAFLFACGGSKRITYTNKVDSPKEVNLPMNSKDYKSDDKYIRVVAQGKSPDIGFARRIALTNAQSEMANMIKVSVTGLGTGFSNQRTDGENMNFAQEMTATVKILTDETLSNLRIKEEKLMKYPNNIYEQWICLEVSRKDLRERMVGKMSTSNLLKLESDRDKFFELLDEELKKRQ